VETFFSNIARAEEMKPSVNYCHEKKAANSVEGLFEKNRKDPLIIKLVALRVGLCTMLDERKITLDSAIVERSKEELMSSPEHAL
jgi:hypothetical protein